jgi:hypothetical protein
MWIDDDLDRWMAFEGLNTELEERDKKSNGVKLS